MALDYNQLSPSDYISFKFKGPGNRETYNVCSDFLLQCLSDYCTTELSTIEEGTLKVLDYGCGPTMINVVSAVPKASEIVLAEYTKSYRLSVQKWLDKDPSAYDWSAYFKHIVQTLEKKSDEDTVKRVKETHEKISAVVSCDINEECIISEGYEGPYDVVMSFHCLDAGCRDLGSFKHGVASLASLLKAGGHLLLYTSKREKSDVGFYTVNGTRVCDALPLSKEFVVNAIEQAGLTNIRDKFIATSPGEASNVQGFYFFSARKHRV